VSLPPDSTADRQPCPLIADTERSRTSVIINLSTWVTGSVCCALQTYRRPSSPDPPGCAPPSQGRTLHHECPDPSGNLISAPEADATGRATSRDVSASCSPPLRRTSLSGRPPSDPWGCRCKMRNLVGCIRATLSAPMDPLHQRRPLMAMLIHTCSHAR
jgi:hypothetical protein